MKEETTTILVFTIIVIQTSLAVEMDIFAGPHRRDQEIKNERPIIGTLAFSKEDISYKLNKNCTMTLSLCRVIRCPTNMSRRLHHETSHVRDINDILKLMAANN